QARSAAQEARRTEGVRSQALGMRVSTQRLARVEKRRVHRQEAAGGEASGTPTTLIPSSAGGLKAYRERLSSGSGQVRRPIRSTMSPPGSVPVSTRTRRSENGAAAARPVPRIEDG